MTACELARRWLEKQPPAISGSGGHNATFHVACVLVNGFSLSRSDAASLMSEFNSRCQPPWTERELNHKLADAERAQHEKPRGFMLKGIKEREISRTPAAAGLPAAPVKAAKYSPDPEAALPTPIEDGARALLRALFKPGEGIRIAKARLNEDAREVPEDAGPCLSREEWLRKLDAAGGNPNAIFSSTKRTGIYVSVNPMRIGGSKDSDVTSYRHALIEFDDISPLEQWNLYSQSGLPCSAIISSGGKSIHAWVRIEAKDRAEFDARVKFLYDHFERAGYSPDRKNRNPSRFSRLPNCIRFNSRQELLALNTGCESFTEWQTRIQADGIGQVATVDELLEFDPAADKNSLLGQRWLCRGGSCLIVGPSGVGKSSLIMQLAVSWALGRSPFGIAPARPLKSLVIQAENDIGDMSEMLSGVLHGMGIGLFNSDAELEMIRGNLVFVRDTSHTGYEFTEAVRRLIDRHKPDLVWFDPLLSFIGADISKQEVCSQFLRGWLNPISDATGVVWMCVHHTGKPPTDKKAREGWNLNDFAYAGIGSSELVNWARAAMSLRVAGDHVFELKLAKRGKRAGATHLTGEPTTSLWLRHSDQGIHWQQIEPPEEIEEPRRRDTGPRERKPTIPERVAAMNLHSFLAACPAEGEGKRAIVRRLCNWCAECDTPVDLKPDGSGRTAVELLVENKKLVKRDELYFPGANR